MANSNKKQLILGAFTLALGLGLYGCGQKLVELGNTNANQNRNQNVNLNQNQNSNLKANIATITVATSTVKLNTSNWKTYQTRSSELFGINKINNPFEFKYPISWFIDEGGIDGSFSISLHSYNPKTHIEDKKGDISVEIEMNYPINLNNFITGLSIKDWCNDDLLSADYHSSKTLQDNTIIIERGKEMINNVSIPYVLYGDVYPV